MAGSCLGRGAVGAETQRALIVDDEFRVRSLIARWLGEAGFECLEADEPRPPAIISATATYTW